MASKDPIDYVAIATQYASDVVLGYKVVNRKVIAACTRYLSDIKRADQNDPTFPYILDDDSAGHICSFVERFPMVKGKKGLIALLDWQVFFFVNVYGWVERDLGWRRFQTAYLEMPKKQGKSTIVAPVALYGLCMDDEEGAEVYCAAVSREQAKVVWQIAHQMAMRTPAFRERFGVECGAQAITHAPSGSTFQALSKEAKSLEGKNPSLALVDELHRHQTREVWDILDESRGAREQPLIIAITNSGSDKSSICYEQRTYGVRVLNGYKDETFFALIYGIDDEDIDKWDQPETWYKAQPSLGHSVSEASVARLCRKAKSMPGARSSFMRYQLGIWSQGETAWMRADLWAACENKSITEESMAGQRCSVGFDLASKKDLAAMVAVFENDGKLKVISRLYLPKARLEDNPSYKAWEIDGYITATEGETIDFSVIEADFLEWIKLFDVENAPYDPHQAHQFATRMQAKNAPMIEFAQNAKNYSEPMKEIERCVIDGDLQHDGNEAMTWMIENVVIEPDRNENIFPRKERKESKIDGPVAMIMAGAMYISQITKNANSIYKTRGFRQL